MGQTVLGGSKTPVMKLCHRINHQPGQVRRISWRYQVVPIAFGTSSSHLTALNSAGAHTKWDGVHHQVRHCLEWSRGWLLPGLSWHQAPRCELKMIVPTTLVATMLSLPNDKLSTPHREFSDEARPISVESASWICHGRWLCQPALSTDPQQFIGEWCDLPSGDDTHELGP